jgi:hypothetical protein
MYASVLSPSACNGYIYGYDLLFFSLWNNAMLKYFKNIVYAHRLLFIYIWNVVKTFCTDVYY